jgi:hypothetical protein
MCAGKTPIEFMVASSFSVFSGAMYEHPAEKINRTVKAQQAKTLGIFFIG